MKKQMFLTLLLITSSLNSQSNLAHLQSLGSQLEEMVKTSIRLSGLERENVLNNIKPLIKTLGIHYPPTRKLSTIAAEYQEDKEPKTVENLITKKLADVNYQSKKYSDTPIVYALANKCWKIALFLAQHGADKNIEIFPPVGPPGRRKVGEYAKYLYDKSRGNEKKKLKQILRALGVLYS